MRPSALVVEDDGPTRALLKQLLSLEGFEVEVAVDGERATDAMLQHDYDVVLLDIILPKRSGTEVMDVLVRERPEILERIIVVTGVHSDEIRALFPSITSVMGKPVIPARLLESVRRVSGRLT